ncbi:MAG: hypothetical protein AB3N19_16150 [Ruegeria sp.]
MANVAAKAREFRRKFHEVARKTGKAKKETREKAFYRLQGFIAGLKTSDAVEACLTAFLTDYARLGDSQSDEYVLAVFLNLVFQLTDLIQSDLHRLQAFRQRLTEGPSKDGISEVFNIRTPPYRRQARLKAIDDYIAKEARAAHRKRTLIDELRTAYKIRHAGKHPRNHDLYMFEALPPGKARDRLKTIFEARYRACSSSYAKVEQKFNAKTLAAVFKSRQRFIDFLHNHRGKGLEIYQIWHWMVHKMNVVLDKNDRWQTRRQPVPDRRMNADLYLMVVHVLLTRAVADKNFPRNHAGFTDPETGLFYAPLHYESFKHEYALFFRRGVRSTRQFRQLAQAHIGLYLYGESLGPFVALAKQTVAQRISKARVALDPKNLSGQSVDIGSQTRRAAFKGVLKIDTEIGLREGRFRIYYVVGPKEVYIQFLNLSNVLFKVDDTWLSNQVESGAYNQIYDKTKHLSVAIPFLFEVLGYFPTLVTGGLFAVAKEVVVDRVADATLDQIGPSSAGGPGGGAIVAAFAKSLRRKSAPDTEDLVRARKSLGRLGETTIDPADTDDILKRDFIDTSKNTTDLDMEGDALWQPRIERGTGFVPTRDPTLTELVDDLDITANPSHRGERGSRRVGTYEKEIEVKAQTDALRKAFNEPIAQFVDNFMPPGTSFHPERVHRNTTGRAQQAATSRRGIPFAPEFEAHFKLPSGIKFMPDDIVPAGSTGYRFVDHKTVFSRENSLWATEKGAAKLRQLMHRHKDIYYELREYGCRGFRYTFDDPVAEAALRRAAREIDPTGQILQVH